MKDSLDERGWFTGLLATSLLTTSKPLYNSFDEED